MAMHHPPADPSILEDNATSMPEATCIYWVFNGLFIRDKIEWESVD
jgi:hypothetical protein